MKQKEIKIKSYQYILQNLLIFFAVISVILFTVGMMYAVNIDGFDYRAIIFISIMIPVICLWIIGAFITRLGCRTYDVYSETGIKRIRGEKIVFDVKWDNIRSAIYFPLFMVIMFMPNILNIYFKEPLSNIEYHEPDYEKSVSTPMSKRTLKRIVLLMPEENKKKFHKENNNIKFNKRVL